MLSNASAIPHDDDFSATVQRFASVRATVEENPRGTVEPHHDNEARAAQHAAEVLSRIATGREGIEIEKTLGEGGMGVVRLGRQTSLRRSVAVKTLRDEARDATSTLRLLREAWITGALEHPNVVPLHDLQTDEQGGPQLVMKRIEGVEWTALMADSDTVAQRFHARSLLEWNLDILQQVTNAVAFAHSRGILHRDIKPENVMIGSFGEVYVVDWGIAVALRDDGSGMLPLAADATELAGTPAYMAPEMLGATGAKLTERTDVYLLGAVLCEVLSGRPPHSGVSLPAMIAQISRSQPELPDDAPPELARICRRAMDPDPDARFESAVQFRLAIQGYLQHHGAMLLCSEAETRLAALRRDISAGMEGVDREWLYDHFSAARFGFQQSLRVWKENHAALRGLTEATVLMIEHELEQGDPSAAATLLAELHDAPRDLVDRVEAAKREALAERVRLERQAGDFDPKIGWKTRTVLGFFLGIYFSAMLVLQAFFGYFDTHEKWVLGFLFEILILLAVGRWASDTMTRTAFNRRIAWSMTFVFVAQALLVIGAWVAGVGMLTTSILFPFVWFVITAHTAIALDKRLSISAVGYLAAFFLSARYPEKRWWIMSASNLVLAVNVVVAGARQEPFAVRVEQVKAWTAARRRAVCPRPPDEAEEGA